MIVVGVDPGSGVDSPTGIAIFDPEKLTIYLATTISSKSKSGEERAKDICTAFERRLTELVPYAEDGILVSFENFVMRGKGGQVLQRLIGALSSRVPKNFQTIHVYNTTVKKVVGGTGRADKEQVARGVGAYFSQHDNSYALVHGLAAIKQYDILDAFAIGITGYYNAP
jgi:Holliday junction resolvasome RuvABC endonuclease subunit